MKQMLSRAHIAQPYAITWTTKSMRDTMRRIAHIVRCIQHLKPYR